MRGRLDGQQDVRRLHAAGSGARCGSGLGHGGGRGARTGRRAHQTQTREHLGGDIRDGCAPRGTAVHGRLEFAPRFLGIQGEELGARGDDQRLAGDQTIDVAPDEGPLIGAVERHGGLGIGGAGRRVSTRQRPESLAAAHRTDIERKALAWGRDIASRAARHGRQAGIPTADRGSGPCGLDVGRAPLGLCRRIEQDGIALDQTPRRPHGLDEEVQIGFAHRILAGDAHPHTAIRCHLGGEAQLGQRVVTLDPLLLKGFGRGDGDAQGVDFVRSDVTEIDLALEGLIERGVGAQGAQFQREGWMAGQGRGDSGRQHQLASHPPPSCSRQRKTSTRTAPDTQISDPAGSSACVSRVRPRPRAADRRR